MVSATSDRTPDYCVHCGASIYWTPVRLAGGTVRLLPVDMVPWTGDRTALRLARDGDGLWHTAPRYGPWQEHACAGSVAGPALR